MTKAERELEKLREKEQEIKSQISAVKARVRDEKRADDTRRRILIGAMEFKKIRDGRNTKERLLADLDAYLDKAKDRALFDLDSSDGGPARKTEAGQL